MTIQAFEELVEGYTKWLQDTTVLRQVANTDWVEITTPYLDRHNDYIQIYVQQQDDEFLITDGGETIEDLQMSGCNLENLLQMTLNGFGVKMEQNMLTVRASMQNFPMRTQNLIQAVLAINVFQFAQQMADSQLPPSSASSRGSSGI